jgi:hypothetical protein
MQRIRRKAALTCTTWLLAQAIAAAASAAPQQLACAVTAASGQPASQSQSILIVFDDAAKTLQATMGTQNYKFNNVSVSNIAISGDAADISIGIDRSSLGLVWQQYGANTSTIAYGQCHPIAASPATANH